MSFPYDFYISDTTNIVSKQSDLQTRLNSDLEITPAPTSITFDNGTQILTVTFSYSLSVRQSSLLQNMIDIIFYALIPGLDLHYNDQVYRARDVDSTSSTPGVNSDIDAGYNVGSLIFTQSTSTIYMCVSNTKGAAVWIPIRNNNLAILSSNTQSSIPSTTLYTSPTTSLYQVSIYLTITQVALGGSVSVTVSWTDQGGAKTYTTGNLSLLSLAYLQDVVIVQAISSSNINISTTVAGLVGTPTYNLRVCSTKLF